MTATDWSPHALDATAVNATRNGVEVSTAVADWGAATDLVAAGPWDLVVAADVLYERLKSRQLLELLPRLTDTVLLAEPGRAPAQAFFDGAKRDWEFTEVSVRESPKVTVHRLSRRRGRQGVRPASRDGARP